ncbi:MAG TPA: PilZ domain-containing protein [Stellaceae bacterium]|nr:PilZ domain-containing protein [Stellaceae bacterium]
MPDNPTSEQRRHARQSGLWSAQLETTSGRRFDCILFDVSSGGAKLRLNEPVAVGEAMTLVSERFGTHGARIAWTAPRQAGLTFLSEARVTTAASVDPGFLRSRAELLRQLAEAGESGIRLAHLADAFERKARTIEKRQHTPPLTIRRDRRPAPVDQ